MKYYDFSEVLDRSQTGSAKWKDMQDKFGNIKTIPLSVADMEFFSPDEIRKDLAEFARTAVYGYTLPTEQYFEAVCYWFKRRYGWEVNPYWVIPSSGVIPALYSCIEAVSLPENEIITMSPVYYPFYEAIERTGRICRPCPLVRVKDTYHINFELLECMASNPNTTALLFCNPHNPVGRVWTEEELNKISNICMKYNLYLISDEIHSDFVMPGYYFHTAGKLPCADRTIICNAPSKTFNLAGLQIANTIISDEILRKKYIAATQANGVTPFLNCFAYVACTTAYSKCEYWLDQLIKYISDNYIFVQKYIESQLQNIKVMKLEGTYLCWIDCTGLGLDQKGLSDLLKRAALCVDEGYLFGIEGSGFIRINLACAQSTLCNALERLKIAILDS